MTNQFGAGKCSICGSSGTSKATCPLNPKAKNPDPKKHPLANKSKSKSTPKLTKSKSKVLPKDSKFLQSKGPGKDVAKPSIKPPLNTMKIKKKTMKKSSHRLEFKEGNSSKFWQIKSVGTDVETNWGKIGNKGSTKVMKFDSKDKANIYIEKQLQSKLKKGYKEINKSSDSKPKNKDNWNLLPGDIKVKIMNINKEAEKKIHHAKFYNIATEIDPEYEGNGHLRAEMDNTENINKVLDKHPEFNPGDILFVGSTYESRQEYGFALFLPGYNNKKVNIVNGEDGFNLPLKIIDNIEYKKKYPDKYKDVKNPLENVRYSKLIQQFKKEVIDNYKPYPNDEEFIIGLFLGTDFRDEEEINEVIQQYKDKHLW
jgi:predicted DNA-binding WGR domain protein